MALLDRAAFGRARLTRNRLYAGVALPPVIFLVSGHVVLGVVFLLCVVAGRLSRPRATRSQRKAPMALTSISMPCDVTTWFTERRLSLV
jgi:hypothetical protein